MPIYIDFLLSESPRFPPLKVQKNVLVTKKVTLKLFISNLKIIIWYTNCFISFVKCSIVFVFLFFFTQFVFGQNEFVAVVEAAFSDEYLNSIQGQIVKIDDMPSSCNEFVSFKKVNFDKIDIYESHGDKVIQTFLETDPEKNIKVLPLNILNLFSKKNEFESQFSKIFNCLNELAVVGLIGVNFSIAAYQKKLEELSVHEEDRIRKINDFIQESVARLENASVKISVALGNEIDRLEEFIVIPHTVLCGRNWSNVKCVTSIEDRADIYGDVYNWADRLSYPVLETPNGTTELPYFVDLRYGNSSNVVAVPRSFEVSSHSSFLAPYVLARSIKGYSVRDVNAFVLPLEGTRLELVSVPLIYD